MTLAVMGYPFQLMTQNLSKTLQVFNLASIRAVSLRRWNCANRPDSHWSGYATGAELLFKTISQRYERSSTMITYNLPFGE